MKGHRQRGRAAVPRSLPQKIQHRSAHSLRMALNGKKSSLIRVSVASLKHRLVLCYCLPDKSNVHTPLTNLKRSRLTSLAILLAYLANKVTVIRFKVLFKSRSVLAVSLSGVPEFGAHPFCRMVTRPCIPVIMQYHAHFFYELFPLLRPAAIKAGLRLGYLCPRVYGTAPITQQTQLHWPLASRQTPSSLLFIFLWVDKKRRN